MWRGEEISLLTLRLGVGKGGWSRRKHRKGISRGKRADIPGSVMLFDPYNISFLWMRKITLREVKPCIQDHTATKEQRKSEARFPWFPSHAPCCGPSY